MFDNQHMSRWRECHSFSPWQLDSYGEKVSGELPSMSACIAASSDAIGIHSAKECHMRQHNWPLQHVTQHRPYMPLIKTLSRASCQTCAQMLRISCQGPRIHFAREQARASSFRGNGDSGRLVESRYEAIAARHCVGACIAFLLFFQGETRRVWHHRSGSSGSRCRQV